MPFDKFTTMTKISKLECPIKIICGDLDLLINVSHGKKLYELVQNKKYKPIWIQNAGHCDLIDLISIKIKKIIF